MRRRPAGQAATLALAAFLAACAPAPPRSGAPLATVPGVDLARYEGRWFEIARYPNRFQSQCAGDVTATYARRADGAIDVVNACRRSDGTQDAANGVARVVDPVTNAKLEVRFAPEALAWLPVVWGDYWILALDPAYRYALVGEPSREYLWILSRSATLPEDDFARLADAARRAGYDPSRLQRTPQGARAPS
jgi:apolipoprotein D and lipocalin family protein